MGTKVSNTPELAAATKPSSAQTAAKFREALALHQRGQLAQAQGIYNEILTIHPKHFDALHLSGVIAAQTNDPKKAVELITKAIEINPYSAAAYTNRGSALTQLKRLEAALASYNQAIAVDAACAEAHLNRGIVLKELGRFDAAIASCDRAISAKAAYAEAHFIRGNVLNDLKQLDSALASYNRALAIKADYAEAYFSRGIVLSALKQLGAALASFDQAVALRPRYADAYFNKSLASLLAADFETGWKDYEWRWKLEHRDAVIEKRNFSQPLWIGKDSIAGKTILLHAEQGLGDTLQFCRYAKPVANLGATVILEVQEPLVSLLAGLDGVSQVVAKGSALPDFDYQCPLLSLPLAFKTKLNSIPGSNKYLNSNPIKVAEWQVKLGEASRPRIGIAWSGRPTHTNDHNRSIRLADFVPHLPAGFQYVSLQKDVREVDIPAVQSCPNLLHFAGDQMDFSDSAALCDCMDLIISVDTSVAHLSGALGRKTWVLLPFRPDWRWLLNRDDSPWYESVKLFRQERIGSWIDVFEQVGAELGQIFSTKNTCDTDHIDAKYALRAKERGISWLSAV